jgi:hypothetical protein
MTSASGVAVQRLKHDKHAPHPHQILDKAVRDDRQRELDDGDNDAMYAVRYASAPAEDRLTAEETSREVRCGTHICMDAVFVGIMA